MLRRGFFAAAIGSASALLARKRATPAADVFHKFEIEVNGSVFNLTIAGPPDQCDFGISIPCRIKSLGRSEIPRIKYRDLNGVVHG
jgi:hypothetical protein